MVCLILFLLQFLTYSYSEIAFVEIACFVCISMVGCEQGFEPGFPTLSLECVDVNGELSLQVPFSQIPWNTNDENYVGFPFGKVETKQPAFTVHVDEPEQTRQKKPVSRKALSSEEALGLKTAVASMGIRKPLTPIDNPMDLTSGESVHPHVGIGFHG